MNPMVAVSAHRPGAAGKQHAAVWHARRFFPKKLLLKYLTLALALSAAPEAMAVDRWFDCTSGSLLTASCWSANTLPNAADTAYIGYSSYAQNVTTTLASGTLNVDLEYIGHSTRNGTVTQTGGTHIVDKNLYLGFNSGITGTYNLQGGTLTTNNDGGTYVQIVGNSGTGNFTNSGGTHNSGPLFLGYLAGSTGNYNLSGTASLNAKQYLQVGASGTGVFTQTGGTNSVDLAGPISTLLLGAGSTGHGTYNLSAGSLAAGTAIVGNSGTGIFNQPGGVHTLSGSIFDGSLVVGGNSGSNGTYNLSGAGNLIANSGTIGQGGTGTFTQTGGAHTVTNNLTLGANSGGSGTYTLSGGTLSVGGNIVNGAGTGSLKIDGGTLTVGGGIDVDTLTLASATGSTGSHTLSGTSTLTATSELIGVIGAGNFTQTGGTNTVTSQIWLGMGAGSSGTYTQSGGTTTADELYVGITTSGTYDLSGSGNLTTRHEIIGQGGTSSGTFTQSGGVHTVTGTMELWGTSTYNLQGGTLDAANITHFAGGGIFNFTGGTLAVDQFTGNLVNNGGTLAPGNSPGTTNITGDYTQLAAGIFDVELGGLLVGSEYDVLNVSGTASLDGTLNVSLFDLGSGLFAPQAGNSFDILTAETLSGGFTSLNYTTLINPNLAWQIDYLIDAIGTTDVVRLSVVSAVPVPPAVWLFGSGLLGLLGLARRKKQ